MRTVRSEGPFAPIDVGSIAMTMPTNNVFWYHSVRLCGDLERARQSNWNTVRDALTDLGKDEKLTDIYELSYSETKDGIQNVRSGFLLGRLKNIDTGIRGFSAGKASGQVYFPKESEQSPVFTATPMDRNYIVVGTQSMSHCAYIAGLAQGAAELSQLFGHLLCVGFEQADLRGK